MAVPYRLLKIRRGLKADLPVLMDGEIGWCTDTEELFIGNSGTNILISNLYDPGNPSDWAPTAPTTITGALDRLASAVEGLLGGQIP